MRAPAGTRLLGRVSAFTGWKALPTPLLTMCCFGWFYVRFTGRIFAQKEPPHLRSPTDPPHRIHQIPWKYGIHRVPDPEHPAQPASV